MVAEYASELEGKQVSLLYTEGECINDFGILSDGRFLSCSDKGYLILWKDDKPQEIIKHDKDLERREVISLL